MLATGSAYLARGLPPILQPSGFGLALYFASQGAGKLLWPLLAGLLRLGFGIGAGWLLLTASGAIEELFLALGEGARALRHRDRPERRRRGLVSRWAQGQSPAMRSSQSE